MGDHAGLTLLAAIRLLVWSDFLLTCLAPASAANHTDLLVTISSRTIEQQRMKPRNLLLLFSGSFWFIPRLPMVLFLGYI